MSYKSDKASKQNEHKYINIIFFFISEQKKITIKFHFLGEEDEGSSDTEYS